MISTIFVPGAQKYAFDSAAPNSQTMILGLSEEKRLLVERELVRLDRDETERFQRLDHRRPIGDIAAVGEAPADEDPRRRVDRGGVLAHVGEDAREGLAALGMGVLAGEAGEPVAGDRVLEKNRSRPDLADEAMGNVEPRDQGPLPGP